MIQFTVWAAAVLLFVSPFVAAEPAPLGGNAAELYRQAFAKLPELTDDEYKALFIEGWFEGKWSDQAARTIKRFDEPLALMRRAMAEPRCDWTFDIQSVLGKPEIPHLAEFQTLIRAAGARAAWRFGHGRVPGAADDCLAAMLFARHFAKQGLMIHAVMGLAGEGNTRRALADNLTRLNSDQLRAVGERLAKLPAMPRLKDTRALEDKFIAHHRREVFAAAKAGGDAAAFDTLINLIIPADVGGVRKRLREASGGTFAGVVRLFEEAEAFERRELDLLGLPWAKFGPHATALDKEAAESKNPLIRDRFVTITRTGLVEFVNDAQNGMLRAAVAVLLGGPEKLADCPDPFGDGPFTLVRPAGAGSGFELRSKLPFDGEPTKLRVGLPAETPKE